MQITKVQTYRKYSSGDIIKAYKLVKEKGVSARKACRIYAIPRMPLMDRLSGKINVETVNSGPKPIIPNEDGKKMVEHI